MIGTMAWRAALSAAAVAAAGAAWADAAMDARIEALAPDLEAYIEKGMQDFGDPALAIGIVSGDRLVWSRGFGLNRAGEPVDDDTIFQIGSASKGFLATTMAIAVDRGTLAWDDRVVDRLPEFQMHDPWVSEEFRVFDLLAQRSGLMPYANDMLGLFGVDEAGLIRSLRFVEPVSSFRSSFAYTNITHMAAGLVVARAFGQPDWEAVVRAEIFEPLGMTRSSLTAEAIESAENATIGNFYDPSGSVEVPFTPLFPYAFGGAGAINSTVNDLVPWVRLHLAGGSDGSDGGSGGGKPIVSAENLGVTKLARVGMTPAFSYAMGWVLQSTPNGLLVWHNGGTTSYGAYLGTAPGHDVGVIVLSNLTNVGFPDAVGEWTLDRLLGNPEVDHAAARLAAAKAAAAAAAETLARPAEPAPPPPLAPLAGDWANPALGDATVAVEGERLVMALATGARLALAPWDGDVFAVGLVPEGRFEAVAQNLGGQAVGFGQFLADASGKPNRLRLTMAEDGQLIEFARR
jgi:CubicO group peptidase (beta-lactamase class C family)